MQNKTIKSDDPMTAAFQALAAGADLRKVDFVKPKINCGNEKIRKPLPLKDVRPSVRCTGEHVHPCESDRLSLIELNEEKKTTLEMAHIFGVSQNTIYQWLDKWDIELWYKGMTLTKADITPLKEHFKAGGDRKSFAKMRNTTIYRVQNFMTKHNIKVKDYRKVRRGCGTPSLLPNIKLAQAQKLLNSKWKDKAIAESIGVSIGTLRYAIYKGRLHRNCNHGIVGKGKCYER